MPTDEQRTARTELERQRRKIFIPDGMWEQVNQLADEHGLNANEEVRIAIEEYLRRHGRFTGRPYTARLQRRVRADQENSQPAKRASRRQP